jgi:hypothetical protein
MKSIEISTSGSFTITVLCHIYENISLHKILASYRIARTGKGGRSQNCTETSEIRTEGSTMKRRRRRR